MPSLQVKDDFRTSRYCGQMTKIKISEDSFLGLDAKASLHTTFFKVLEVRLSSLSQRKGLVSVSVSVK
jgi:hypothetical protein